MGTTVNLVGLAFEKVLFPSMSKVQNEPERLATAYRRGVAITGLILLPISAAAWVLAPEVINVLLGPAWQGAIMPFRILVIGVMFRASYKVSVALVGAKGAVYRNAWRQGIYALLVVAGAWIGQHWGLAGVAFGVFVALTIHFLLMAQFAMSLIPFTWRQFGAVHLPAVWLTVVVGLEVWLITALLRDFNVAPIFVLAINALLVSLSVLLLFRFVPAYFWGADGRWLHRTLLERLSGDRFSRIWRRRKMAQSPQSTN
jgi:PST family polysaccharide transporter